MALGTLSFRSRSTGVTAEELPVGVCVRGEVEWVGEPTGSSSFKGGDIAKMHAYRDALPAVRTAFVLYPGDEFECFPIDGIESGAVGAIPLVPGCGDHQLSLLLRRAVLGST